MFVQVTHYHSFIGIIHIYLFVVCLWNIIIINIKYQYSFKDI